MSGGMNVWEIFCMHTYNYICKGDGRVWRNVEGYGSLAKVC